MSHKRPPKAALIAIGVLLLLLTAVYYGIRALSDGQNGKLKASGTIEAVMVDISPELPGQVRQVLVAEGDQVAADAPLLVLDGSLILQQRAAAQAALESAQAASASAQKYGIISIRKKFVNGSYLAYNRVQLDVDAERLHIVHLGLDDVLGHSELRYTVHQHAASDV